jgi:predicted dehydrogenase
MASPLGVGIVGCGWAAGSVCEAIDAIDGAVVAAAFDELPAAAAKLAGPRGATVQASLDDLLADPNVQLVYVGLPHHLLAAKAEAALQAGKHVLVEKPMALDPAQCRALGQLAEERGLTLCVFFELRKAGIITLARELVRGGAIGAVRAIRIETILDKKMTYWQSPVAGRRHWRSILAEAGGGVVLMNTVHQIDAVRSITGLEAVRVQGEIATLQAPDGVEVEDTAAATLRLSNGGVMSIVAAAHSPGAGEEEAITLDGEHGRIDIPSPWGEAPVRMFLRRPWGEHAAGKWIDLPTERPDFYALMVRDLVEAVRTGSPAPATAADAEAAVRIVFGIYQSAREGRAVDLG